MEGGRSDTLMRHAYILFAIHALLVFGFTLDVRGWSVPLPPRVLGAIVLLLGVTFIARAGHRWLLPWGLAVGLVVWHAMDDVLKFTGTGRLTFHVGDPVGAMLIVSYLGAFLHVAVVAILVVQGIRLLRAHVGWQQEGLVMGLLVAFVAGNLVLGSLVAFRDLGQGGPLLVGGLISATVALQVACFVVIAAGFEAKLGPAHEDRAPVAAT